MNACPLFLLLISGCATVIPRAPSPGTTPVTQLIFRPKSLGPQVSLAWDLSSDPTVSGYRLYSGGASRSYTNTLDVGNTNLATVPVTLGSTYFFPATAYATNGLESDYSVEVSYTVPTPAPVTVAISAQWTTNLDGAWSAVPGFAPILLTNPPGNAFYRLLIQ